MNQTDRKEFEIIHTKIDSIQQDLVELKRDMQKAHDKSDESLKFIKENETYWIKRKKSLTSMDKQF